MTEPKKKLIDFEEPTVRPSIQLAKQIVENLNNGNEPLATGPENILDGYSDQDYSPNMTQIQEWVGRETEAMRLAMASNTKAMAATIEDAQSDFRQNFNEALDAFSSGKIDEEELIDALAKIFFWMDRSPFWGGTPLEAYWHAAKAQSALLRMNERTVVIVDVLYDLLHGSLAQQLRLAEGNKQRHVEDFDLSLFKEELAEQQRKINTALFAQEEMTGFAVKLGFLYRDSWWLEKHGDAALRGYIAKETALKAGFGGSTASSGARRGRIELFLTAHAKMMRENHILVDDPAGDVALRALRLARKAHPVIFGKIGSRNTAVDYWNYIKSDSSLWRKYQALVFDNNELRK